MLQRTQGSTTTNFHWDGWDLVREEKDDGVDVEVSNYLVPHGEILAFERDDEWFYLHGDGLSSTQLVTDDTGAQAARIVYGAWGEELSVNDSVPGGLDVRFVGGLGVRNDSASGLICMRHRWYDAGLGRFISRDPIGFKGGLNLYEAMKKNPTSFVDPMGLSPWDYFPPPHLKPFFFWPCAKFAIEIVEHRRNSATKEQAIRRAKCARGNPDRVDHCMVSCLTALCSEGSVGTYSIGIAWEVFNPPYESGDVAADRFGAFQGLNPAYRGLSCETLCESQFDEYYQVPPKVPSGGRKVKKAGNGGGPPSTPLPNVDIGGWR